MVGSPASGATSARADDWPSSLSRSSRCPPGRAGSSRPRPVGSRSSWTTASSPPDLAANEAATSGERALDGGPVGGPAVRREHMLDRQREQWAQAHSDLLAGHALAEPVDRDLEALADVFKRVARDDRGLALDPEHHVV